MSNFNLEISGSHKKTAEGNDSWWFGGGGVAWSSLAAAKAGVLPAVRSGRTIGVLENGKVVRYTWHPDDITDAGLVLSLELENENLSPIQLKNILTTLGLDYTTQIITSGGNYNDLEITADLVIFTNENAQAILNGVWGKKEFHILNLSTVYEVQINHNSDSISGDGLPISLPTAGGSVGIKGTARILYANESYGYFVADTWGSLYRPEFKGLTETEVVTVNENSVASSKKIIELRVFRDSQSVAMSKADLNIAYPDALRGMEVICNLINKTYLKVDNNTDDWVEISNTNVV